MTTTKKTLEVLGLEILQRFGKNDGEVLFHITMTGRELHGYHNLPESREAWGTSQKWAQENIDFNSPEMEISCITDVRRRCLLLTYREGKLFTSERPCHMNAAIEVLTARHARAKEQA